jgi:hypothetical protein
VTLYKVLREYYSESFRSSVSLILNAEEHCSTALRNQRLREVFQNGNILESIEYQVAYPTFHFEFIDDIDEIRTTEVKAFSIS